MPQRPTKALRNFGGGAPAVVSHANGSSQHGPRSCKHRLSQCPPGKLACRKVYGRELIRTVRTPRTAAP
jgi:hypothetical protein